MKALAQELVALLVMHGICGKEGAEGDHWRRGFGTIWGFLCIEFGFKNLKIYGVFNTKAK